MNISVVMCEQTEVNYLDGEVVWVKLGSIWWPGEVVAAEKLPPDVLPSFRKPPIAVVKFFKEDTYEYVKNINSIYKYNCSRKNEFINKGLYMYRTKHGHMEKFPEDIIHAETAVGGDIEILTRDEFQEKKKESYAGLFGDTSKRTPGTAKKGKGLKGRPSFESPRMTPIRQGKEKVDYKVHILVQGTKATPPTPTSENPPSDIEATPSTSTEQETNKEPPENKDEQPQSGSEEKEKPENGEDPPATPASNMTPIASNSGIYACHACPFTTSRMNVLILHNKSHSVSFSPYTPSPVRKKNTSKSAKSTPNSSKTPKVRRPRKEKSEKEPKKASNKKRPSEEPPIEAAPKKVKTDEEIKSSLLADWDDGDEDSNDESSVMVMAGSPEVPEAAKSPAVPTSAEISSVPLASDMSSPTENNSGNSPASEKPECSSDSKYEFCEDEDWPLEADVGRKIPRVKNAKRKDTKSLSLDDDDVAREVAELLNKTTVPDLPAAPEPLKVEENFPEPSIVKSPDKQEKTPEKSEKPPEVQPTKAIFKTKTFFRSRHSRSQDAIGKYVAEQLNAVERMDISESEINGSEAVSSPEARESPPIEHVKVARLAPKIQLKKMKAEAAQLREKERSNIEQFSDTHDLNQFADLLAANTASPQSDSSVTVKETEDKTSPETSQESISLDKQSPNKSFKDNITHEKPLLDVLYPTQEIKPVNTDEVDHVKHKINKVEIKVNTPIKEDMPIKEINEPIYLEPQAPTIEACEEPENIIEEAGPTIKFPESNLNKAYEQSMEPYMNESTASAVDALLSVSRDADRVTRVVSDDLPEDLFEDEVKDSPTNNINGFNEVVNENNSVVVDSEDIAVKSADEEKYGDGNNELTNNFDEFTSTAKSQDSVSENMLVQGNVVDDKEEEIIMSVPEAIVPTVDENVTSVTKNVDAVPSESVLQIAETLINLPSAAIQSNPTTEQLDLVPQDVIQEEVVHPAESMVLDEKFDEPVPEPISPNKSKSLLITNNDSMNARFETEQEKSENLNAAQSLVQMSESIDHKMNTEHNLKNPVNSKELTDASKLKVKQNNGLDITTIEQKLAMLSNDNNSESSTSKVIKIDTSSSKLLKILEEPCIPKVIPKVIPSKTMPTKHVIVTGKEKILNFDVAKSSFKGKPESPKQKIIIRRTAPSKNVINNMREGGGPEQIILSRSGNSSSEGSVQTYTIQTAPEAPSDASSILHQQRLRKVKPPAKFQKIKPHNSLVSPLNEAKILNETAPDDTMFDINSMPIVLSEDLITPESIEKMPIVMSDGNIITHSPNPPKLVKTKQPIETEKVAISASPSKPEVKTLLMNPVTEVSKVTTPNILSKSSKLRGGKPMLVIDKTTGKQKIIMTKGEPSVKEVKPTSTLIQTVQQNTGKAEKFIILPTPSSPRPGRTQKIVIDPQTGKAHVLVAKGSDTQMSTTENKPVSAKLIPPPTDASTPGSTVMIITNATGAQSRIVLTPEHEKMLFPKKQQTNVTQLKTIANRLSTNTGATLKAVTTVAPAKTTNIVAAKAPPRIVPKQKSAIITSKGQLIVGGRVATTSQNIAPMPEIRTVPKRIMASEPKKLVQAIQKSSPETLIFLQQKSGAVMQLTAAQFEHLQRTGQIVQKTVAPAENKVVLQKTITISPNESASTTIHKPRVRKTVTESPTPVKKLKQEIAIAPAPGPMSTPPALTPLTNTPPPAVPSASNTVSVATTSSFNEFENFEELLPSTAIARQQEAVAPQVQVPQPEPAASPSAPLTDGQLLAVPGEHFGGPAGSFYLCVKDCGTLTPIDNRPLVLENNQLVPMAVEPLPVFATQPERRDILEAALANSDVFHADTTQNDAPDFRDLNANVSVHCRVSETSTTLNQPIMTPVEVPSKVDSEPAVPSNLEDGLAVIGVTPHTVPTSLELPITVTDPRIAPKTTDPLSNNNYGTTLLTSPNTEMAFVTTEETEVPMGGPISMPLLTDEESVGKSMPILTDDVTERTVSSVESTVGSPSSIDVRESENEDGLWSRRLLTPGSDTSEASAEIPLQPVIQLSVNELSRSS